MWGENRILSIVQKIIDWGNESITIPGWLIFGLMVFVLPSLFIYVAWTFPICQSENQSQCLSNIPNVRIFLTITALGFPGMIGIMYLRFVSMQRHIDKIQKGSTK